MYLESIMLSEIRQTDNDKYHMISITCGIFLQGNCTTKRNRTRLTGTENKLLVARREGLCGGWKR